jgi:hypothetical protein
MKSIKLNRKEIVKLKSDMLYGKEILLGEIIFLEKRIKSKDQENGEEKGEYKIHPESFFNVCKALEDLSESIKGVFKNNGEGEQNFGYNSETKGEEK